MTVQQIFELAMPMIDETPVNGVFDADRTADYKEKAPFLLNVLQSEICRDCKIFKELTITKSGTEGYVKITLPIDYLELYQIFDKDLILYQDFKRIGSEIYVPFDFNGKMVYKYQPTTLISLASVVSVSDNIASTVLANGLASQFITTENPDLASFFNQRFQEGKAMLNKPQIESSVKIIDVYKSSLNH